ncbi:MULTISPECIES: DUF1826 domain-containing protein [unclassified Thioalkalivibrio]|uniref:DUF1826 domain-containing protein n=1 Tax=unclassified Thioalkalivibrio TaxID=2621013 RepID=UPI0009DB54CF|nr:MULTISPECIES: DUF1826 domain-containing protein [unclassified Thioalkalivibrio]
MSPENQPANRPGPSSRHRFVDQARELLGIHREEVNALIWRRSLGPALSTQSEALASTEPGMLLDTRCRPDQVRLRLLEATGQPPFQVHLLGRDIEHLAHAFAIVASAVSVRIQLEVLDHQPCPLFHVDNNVLRMLCTYVGPGTEYADERHLNRERLQQNDNEGVLGGRSPLITEAGQAILMKGKRYSSENGRGAVHRSPPIPPGQRRLALRLDYP